MVLAEGAEPKIEHRLGNCQAREGAKLSETSEAECPYSFAPKTQLSEGLTCQNRRESRRKFTPRYQVAFLAMSRTVALILLMLYSSTVL